MSVAWSAGWRGEYDPLPPADGDPRGLVRGAGGGIAARSLWRDGSFCARGRGAEASRSVAAGGGGLRVGGVGRGAGVREDRGAELGAELEEADQGGAAEEADRLAVVEDG